jgi:hypothetical protein
MTSPEALRETTRRTGNANSSATSRPLLEKDHHPHFDIWILVFDIPFHVWLS